MKSGVSVEVSCNVVEHLKILTDKSSDGFRILALDKKSFQKYELFVDQREIQEVGIYFVIVILY